LHLAAAVDHVGAVEALIAKKANVNAVNKHGNIPLVEALLHSSTKVIRVCISLYLTDVILVFTDAMAE